MTDEIKKLIDRYIELRGEREAITDYNGFDYQVATIRLQMYCEAHFPRLVAEIQRLSADSISPK